MMLAQDLLAAAARLARAINQYVDVSRAVRARAEQQADKAAVEIVVYIYVAVRLVHRVVCCV